MTSPLVNKVAVTTEESSPGIPYWGPNQIITEIPAGEPSASFENLLAGKRYYIRTWTEDQFGQKSPDTLRVIDTPPDTTVPAVPYGLTLTAGSFGFTAQWTPVPDLDLSAYDLAYANDDGSGSGPDGNWTVVSTKTDSIRVDQSVGQKTWVKVRSRDLTGNTSDYSGMATVTPYRIDPLIFSAPGVLDSGSPMYCYVKVPDDVSSILSAHITLAFRPFSANATAAASGGSSTSGSSSASSSNNTTLSIAVDSVVDWHDHSGTVPPASGFVTPSSAVRSIDPHSHSIGHTHSTPAHGHGLTYGTYEEGYPGSHSVTVRTYKRVVGAWVLQHTDSGITADLADLDMTGVIAGTGDWRIEVQSEGGQPNGGRLGCDLYGSLIAVIGGSGIIDATTVAGATYLNGSLWVGGVEVFDAAGDLLVPAPVASLPPTTWSEVPSGLIDGYNANFTLAYVPGGSNVLMLFKNGVLQRAGAGYDYTSSGAAITFEASNIPSPGDTLGAVSIDSTSTILVSSSPTSTAWNETPSGAVNGSNTAFTINHSPNPSSALMLFKNGMLQRTGSGNDFTMSGSTVTFLAGNVPQVGDILVCTYPW